MSCSLRRAREAQFPGNARIGSGATSASCRTTIRRAISAWSPKRCCGTRRSRRRTSTPFRPRGASAQAGAAEYETVLKRFYGAQTLDGGRPLFDLTLLGLGEDGHIASLFPGSPALAETRRWAVPVVGESGVDRITLTYPALASSRVTAFLVAGERKRAVLARVRAGDAALPATRLAFRRRAFSGLPIAPRRRRAGFERGVSRCDAGNGIERGAGRRAGKQAPAMPSVLVVMGVSGCGKSTIGTQLALKLHWEFEDGDWFHPARNIDKMQAGMPLTDEDRAPWLIAIAAFIDREPQGRHARRSSPARR